MLRFLKIAQVEVNCILVEEPESQFGLGSKIEVEKLRFPMRMDKKGFSNWFHFSTI